MWYSSRVLIEGADAETLAEGELTKSSTMGEYGVRVGELLPVSLGTLSQSRAH